MDADIFGVRLATPQHTAPSTTSSPGASLKLTWPGVTLTIAPEGMAIGGDRAVLTAPDAESVSCRRTEADITAKPAETTARAVDDETWDRLNALAYRTFAPATEASRLVGAGAGLEDND